MSRPQAKYSPGYPICGNWRRVSCKEGVATALSSSKNQWKTAILATEKELSKPRYRKISDAVVIGFFVFVIIGPIFNIFSTIITSTNQINSTVFNDPLTGAFQWQLMG